jgi:hypothetical protein
MSCVPQTNVTPPRHLITIVRKTGITLGSHTFSSLSTWKRMHCRTSPTH